MSEQPSSDATPNVITYPADPSGFTISAAQVEASTISLPFNGRPLVTIDLADGAMEFGPDYTPDEAARLFWEAVQRLQPAFEQRTGIKDVGAKLRAGAFRDGAEHIRQNDLPDDYIDTFEAGADWAANLLDLMARAVDPK